MTRGRQPRDQVGTIGLGAEKLTLKASLRQVVGEVFLRRALVARRVDRVEADQLGEKLFRLPGRLADL